MSTETQAVEQSTSEPTNSAQIVEAQETPEVAQQEGEAKDGSSEAEKGVSDAEKAMRRLQRRIDKLTAKNGATQAERDMYRTELETLRQQASQPAEDGVDNLHEMVQVKARELAAQTIAQREITGKVRDVLKSGEKLDGFDDAVNSVDSEIPLMDDRKRPTPFLMAVLEAEAPAKLLHYLGKNPELVEDLSDLTPTQIARRLVKIEAAMDEATKPKKSSAPTPLKALNASGVGKSSPSSAADIVEELRALRR